MHILQAYLPSSEAQVLVDDARQELLEPLVLGLAGDDLKPGPPGDPEVLLRPFIQCL